MPLIMSFHRMTSSQQKHLTLVPLEPFTRVYAGCRQLTFVVLIDFWFIIEYGLLLDVVNLVAIHAAKLVDGTAAVFAGLTHA
jgi:hypothetical protein